MRSRGSRALRVADAMSVPESRRRGVELAGLVMIAAPLIALSSSAQEWEILVPLWGALLGYPWLSRRWRWSGAVYGYALAAAVVAATQPAYPVSDASGTPLGPLFFLGVYAVLAGLLRLYGPPGRNTIAPLIWFTVFGMAAASPGMRRMLGALPSWRSGPFGLTLPQPHVTFVLLTAVQGLAMVVGLELERRPQRMAHGRRGSLRPQLIALVAVIGVAALSARMLDRYYRDLNQLLGGLGPRASAGFGDRAVVGAINNRRQSGQDTVAIRAVGAAPPGHLRAKVYAVYQGDGAWVVGRSSGVSREVVGGRVAFARAQESTAALRIYPNFYHRALFFLPLQTAVVTTSCSTVEVYPGRILRSSSGLTSDGYGVIKDPLPIRDEIELDRDRQLPARPNLLAALDGLLAAADPQRAAQTPLALADRLTDHFAAHYRYDLEVDLPRRGEPLVPFLERFKAGHCELFASATVLALRRRGHRARYVTGFLCSEPNPIDPTLWVARYRHAHAWVEVYDPDRGWRTVEPTPPDGQPQVQPLGRLEGLGEWLGVRLRELRSRGWAALVELPNALLALFTALLRWLVASIWPAAIALVVAVGLALRRRRRVAIEAEAEASLRPEVAAAREGYLALEARLAAAGHPRDPAETLHRYAARLEAHDEPISETAPAELAEAIRDYAGLRFGAPGR